MLHGNLAQRKQVRRIGVRAIHAKELDFAHVNTARWAASMRMRTVAIEDDRAFAQSPGFYLNPRKNIVFLDDKIVPMILAERYRYQISGSERGHASRAVPKYRRCVSYSVSVPFPSSHDTRRVCQGCGATQRPVANRATRKAKARCEPGDVNSPVIWSGRRESNPRCLLGRQKHYHYATPAMNTGPRALSRVPKSACRFWDGGQGWIRTSVQR